MTELTLATIHEALRSLPEAEPPPFDRIALDRELPTPSGMHSRLDARRRVLFVSPEVFAALRETA